MKTDAKECGGLKTLAKSCQEEEERRTGLGIWALA